MKNKAIPETIVPNYGSSFRVRKFDVNKKNGAPFWHFHPELQLVYINKGNGKRHIGNHLSYFRKGDLVLIGSNLPHYGLTDQLTGDQVEIIVQFRKEFLGDSFFDLPEMNSILQLIERAKYGIAFRSSVKKQIGPRVEKLYELNSFERMIELVEILKMLSQNQEYKLLNVQDYVIEVKQLENERIRNIYSFVRHNFHESISLDTISEDSNMTVPAFCRYFKKQSGKTFTQFVNEFRIVHACKLLTETDSNISTIAIEAGFNNFSHFNRLFKKINKQSPTEYRADFKEIQV